MQDLLAILLFLSELYFITYMMERTQSPLLSVLTMLILLSFTMVSPSKARMAESLFLIQDTV